MNDQNSIIDNEEQWEKYNRGLDIFIESIHKPDHKLRGCAHNQKCYNELMEVREEVLRYLHTLRRTHDGTRTTTTYSSEA
jgi:hypothetical protein